MTEKQFQIFLTVFLSDKERLEEFKDLQANYDITFKTDNCGVGKMIFTFSLMDILQMNLDVWKSRIDELEITALVNAKTLYDNTLKCMKILIKRGFEKSDDFDYKKHINLIYCLDEDDNWIDECDMYTYEKEGYKKIDLELINYAARRNAKKVKEFLKNGANLFIDPIDKNNESAVLEIVGAAEDYRFTNLYSLHKDVSKNGAKVLKREDSNFMISELYGAASATVIMDIINVYKIKNLT